MAADRVTEARVTRVYRLYPQENQYSVYRAPPEMDLPAAGAPTSFSFTPSPFPLVEMIKTESDEGARKVLPSLDAVSTT